MKGYDLFKVERFTIKGWTKSGLNVEECTKSFWLINQTSVPLSHKHHLLETIEALSGNKQISIFKRKFEH